MNRRSIGSGILLLGVALLLHSGCVHNARDCTGVQRDACNEPVKEIVLEKVILADLGTAKRKDLILISVDLQSLKPDQPFFCQVLGGTNVSSLAKSVNLQTAPDALGCSAPANAAQLRVLCKGRAGETKLLARIIPASAEVEDITVGFVCLPSPMASEPASPVFAAGVPPLHPLGSAQPIHRVGRQTPHPSVPKTAPGTPPVTPSMNEAPSTAAASFPIQTVAEHPDLTVTLTKCKNPKFTNEQGGHFSFSGGGARLRGSFKVTDSDQCQILLTSGVKTEEESKKLKGMIELRWNQ